MDNQEYDSKLGLDITPFQKAIQRATSLFTGFTEALNKKELKLHIADAEKYVTGLQRSYMKLNEMRLNGGLTPEQLDRWDALRYKITEGKERIREMEEELKNMGNEAEGAGEKAFKIPDIFKRMGLAVIGVQSAFSAFRKIVNTALSNNIELSNKFDAIWQSLGNAITPILERIANLILTIFSYLNILVKTLSGGKIDLMAKTSKSAKSTAGSMKEASKYLAGFDELQNVDDDTSGGGGGGGIGGITDPFKDIDLNPEWVEKIQAFGEWVKENWPLVVALLGGTWLALKAGYDMKEMTALWLALGGIYEIFKGIHDLIEGSLNGDLDQISKGFAELAIGIGLISIAIGLVTGNWTSLYGLVATGLMLIVSWVLKHWDEIKQACVNLWNNIKEGWNNTKQAIIDKALEIKQKVVDKWNEIKTNFTTMVDGLKTKWNDFKTNLVSKFEDVKNSIKSKINSIIGFFEGLQHKGADVINNITSGINSKLKISIPSWIPVIGGKSWSPNIGKVPYAYFNRLDTGTNYVPNDQLAMIHKGEAVIPKKFNSEEYFNNAETAEKLDRVIDLLENIDFQPYITVKDIGTTATKYQAQQVRIMGGKL